MRVLLVEDSESDALLVLEELKHAGFAPVFSRVQTAEAMQAALAAEKWDIVLCDYRIPSFDVTAALEVLHKTGLELPFLMVSDIIGKETAVVAMKLGVTDYLLLKDRRARLRLAICQALEQSRFHKEHKQTEEALRLFRNLVDQSNDTIEVIDPGTARFLDVNEKGPAELGCTRAEYLALRVFEIDPMVTVDSWPKLAEKIRLTGALSGEGRHRRKDGTTFPIEFNAKWVHLGRDYIVTVVRDISTQKRAEGALLAKQAQLLEALSITRLAYWEYDVLKDEFIFNDQFYSVLRTTAEREGGYTMSSEKYTRRFVHPDDLAVVGQEIQRALTTTDPNYRRELDHRIIYTDGETGHVNVHIRVEKDAQGRTIRTRGAYMDITGRKQAEGALAAERTLLRTLFDLLPDHIYVKDLQGRFITCNDRCARAMGAASAAELIGKTDADYFPPEMEAGYRADELMVLTGTALIDKEEKNLQGGELRTILTNKLPLRDSLGKIIGIVGNGRDITQRLQLEEQLRQSQKMEAIGQLAGGVAHDFNNLLTVIKGHIGLLRAKNQVPPEIADSIQQIDEAADRAANLTRQLLTFSRQQVMQPIVLNLNGVVFNLAKMLRRLLSETIQMEVECLPQPLLIRADEGMVEQVLLNLVVNARDALPKAGTLRITTQPVDLNEPAARAMMHGRAGAFVCLAVSDTGTGIAPEVLPRIFEPFFTTKGIGKGTGIGLATVYAIMQQHGGWINVESVVGRGSTFRAYFPRLATALPTTPAGQDGLPVRGGHEGILLVEDESAVRVVAEAALVNLGYRVFTAPSGLAALQVWEMHRHEIELLLTDLVMPDGITGRDLALRLRASAPQLAVIYMSGYSQEMAGGDFPLEEGTNFLAKPFDLTGLAKLVRASLDRGVTNPPFTR